MENSAKVSIGELALAKGIDPPSVGRALWLTLLAPDIFEAILEDRLTLELW